MTLHYDTPTQVGAATPRRGSQHHGQRPTRTARATRMRRVPRQSCRLDVNTNLFRYQPENKCHKEKKGRRPYFSPSVSPHWQYEMWPARQSQSAMSWLGGSIKSENAASWIKSLASVHNLTAHSLSSPSLGPPPLQRADQPTRKCREPSSLAPRGTSACHPQREVEKLRSSQ